MGLPERNQWRGQGHSDGWATRSGSADSGVGSPCSSGNECPANSDGGTAGADESPASPKCDSDPADRHGDATPADGDTDSPDGDTGTADQHTDAEAPDGDAQAEHHG